MRNLKIFIGLKDEDTGEIIRKTSSHSPEIIEMEFDLIERKKEALEDEVERDMEEMVLDEAERIKKQREIQKKLK